MVKTSLALAVFLQCETLATRPSGGGRTYRFLINYNRTMKRFEMLSLWSNVPHKAIQTLTPNDARDRWSIRELAVVGGDPASAPISFVETWTKLP